MAKFCFYKGDDENIVERLRRAAIFCWGDIEEAALDSFHLFVASDDYEQAFHRTETLVGAMSGYAECGDANGDARRRRFFAEITEKKWSLGDEWGGSFAAIAYSSEAEEITLCNDLIGHFPLYYADTGKGFCGGTSLIILSRALDCETDAVGVLQRISVPFCNYGRRTLLKKVFRLLPGERLQRTTENADFRREYDNSLCREVLETDVKTAARQVWDCLQNEITAAIGDRRKIAVAASGGWDSRLVLGGIGGGDLSVECLTYGSAEHYETRIARRCAEVIGAAHECFPIEGKYFPARGQIETLVKETESANYFEWFGMIEKRRAADEKIPLLLGDLCESIDGRYMSAFSSRQARVKSYVREMFGKRESFAAADARAFERWRDEKRIEITTALLANLKNLSADLRGSLTEKQIAAEIAADLEASFARIGDHEPPFAAMYDELFIWFHRIRFLLGNQISWLGAAFQPFSPGLSMRFLRLITTVHPRHRIRKRLMNRIIELPEFDRLARIPSAQIPFLSSRTPAFVRDAAWGTRSILDQLLIKRTLRRKNADGRQRVLPSLDYIKEYRRAETGANVEGWFSGRHLKSGNYLRLVRERAALNAWTLINVDIAAPANVSITLDLCRAEARKALDKQTAAKVA